jgi:hypothetical protein
MTGLAIFAITLASIAGLAAFHWPHGVFRRSAIAAAGAIAGPFAIGFVLNPFLGDGAGLGVVFILATCSPLLRALRSAPPRDASGRPCAPSRR